MIRQLRVRGYKSLQDDTLTMRPLRILIGANAAGKSNVVDALRFLPEAVPSDVATALARRGGLPTVVFLGSPEKRFELGLDYGMPGSDDGETPAEFRYTLVVAEHDGMPGVSVEALKNAPNGRAALNQAWLQSAWGKGSAPKHHDEQHPTTFELDSETTLALRAVGVFDE